MEVLWCFRKIKDLVEQCWIVIAPFFSFLGIIFEKIQLVALQKIFYLLSIFVLILGIVELAQKRKIRKTGFTSKAEKTVRLAMSPELQVEEKVRMLKIYERMFRAMFEKTKKVFKWIMGNKLSLTSIIGSIAFIGLSQYALYSDILMQWDFFNQNSLAVKIVGGILTLLFLINLIYTIVTKYGFENLDQISNRLNEVKEKKEKRLTKEQKLEVKNKLNSCKEILKKAEDKVSNYQKVIENYKVLMSIEGLQPSQEDLRKYNEAIDYIAPSKREVEQLTNQCEILKKALKN